MQNTANEISLQTSQGSTGKGTYVRDADLSENEKLLRKVVKGADDKGAPPKKIIFPKKSALKKKYFNK